MSVKLPPPPRLYDSGKIWSPGTPADLAERRACAIDCWVFRMRRQNVRLPPGKVDEPFHALLLPTKWSDDEDWFRLELHDASENLTGEWRTVMMGARLVRFNDGVRVFQGDEWHHADHQHWRQSWLCTPTAERGYEILRAMAGEDV